MLRRLPHHIQYCDFHKKSFHLRRLICLILSNTKVSGAFIPYIQWIVGGLVTIYILTIELYGYNVQPLIDFRQYSIGTSLIPSESDDEDSGATVYEFTYSKDGEERTFTIDSLPDSTWTFVSRRLIGGNVLSTDGFTIVEDGEDITADIIDPDTEQFIITIPDIDNVDLSYTYLINELNDFISGRGGSLVALINSDEEGLERWKDISMPPIPFTRPTRKCSRSWHADMPHWSTSTMARCNGNAPCRQSATHSSPRPILVALFLNLTRTQAMC